MSLLGRAAVAMWWDVPSARSVEWEDWHTHEHMPERVAIPGFQRGSRWKALSGKPSYFVLYEAATLATLTRGAYLKHLNHPTPWSRKMMPHHRNMVRSLCRVRASYGGGVPAVLATLRFSPAEERVASLRRHLNRVLEKLPTRKGLGSAHLLESLPASGTPKTAEQKIRGGDATADWVLLIGGYDVDAVKSVSAKEFGALPDRQAAFYRPGFVLTSSDLR